MSDSQFGGSLNPPKLSPRYDPVGIYTVCVREYCEGIFMIFMRFCRVVYTAAERTTIYYCLQYTVCSYAKR